MHQKVQTEKVDFSLTLFVSIWAQDFAPHGKSTVPKKKQHNVAFI